MTQFERIQAKICTEDRSSPGEAQKIAQLPRAASYFKNFCVWRDLVIQQLCKNALVGLLPKAPCRVKALIVWKRVFFIKGLYDLGNIALGGSLIGPEQERDPTLNWERSSTGGALEIFTRIDVQPAATSGANQQVLILDDQARDFILRTQVLCHGHATDLRELPRQPLSRENLTVEHRTF